MQSSSAPGTLPGRSVELEGVRPLINIAILSFLALLGGKLKIESSPGAGTTIVAEVPLR